MNGPAAGRYAKLLARALPAVITTEKEHARHFAIMEGLIDKGDSRSPEEDKLLKLEAFLIEDFETKHCAVNASTPVSLLKSLMEARDLRPKDLWSLFGSKGVTSEVLSGKREISKTHAKKLAGFFHVSVELFI